jgi:hypothetical protein
MPLHIMSPERSSVLHVPHATGAWNAYAQARDRPLTSASASANDLTRCSDLRLIIVVGEGHEGQEGSQVAIASIHCLCRTTVDAL